MSNNYMIDRTVQAGLLASNPNRWRNIVEIANLISEAENEEARKDIIRGLFELLLTTPETTKVLSFEEVQRRLANRDPVPSIVSVRM